MSKQAKPNAGPKKQKAKKKNKQKHENNQPVSASDLTRFVEFSRLISREYGPLVTAFDGSGKLTRRRSRDIPFDYPDFFKGTQVPVYRLKLLQIGITTVAATVYNTVFSLSASQLNNFTDVANMWDEYRILRGEFEYHARFSYAGSAEVQNYFGVAAVDYSIATAFGSFDSANAHDTRKLFNLVSVPGSGVKPGRPHASWPVKFEKLPDQEWIPTTTTTTAFCYWKPRFEATDVRSSLTNIGFLLGWFDIQVRGQAG